MQIGFLLFFALLGTIFGSFGSVLIYRFYSREGGIGIGRSHCTSCNHTLGFFDLFPVFSYLFLGGKCRYCKKSVSKLYPILEIVMGFTFFLVGNYLVNINGIFAGDSFEIIRLIFFLYITFVIVIFSFYDILYQLIPTEILGPAILVLLVGLILSIFSVNINEFYSYFIPFGNHIISNKIINALLGSLFIYTFLYLQILLPGIYYAIEKKKYKIILVQFIDYFIIPFYMIASVFFNIGKDEKFEETNEEEIYTGMGHGDLWIAIFMGLVGGFKIAVLGLALSYLIGSIFGIYILAIKKQRNTRIAFGPFLGVGLLLSLVYYEPIINLYFSILGIN